MMLNSTNLLTTRQRVSQAKASRMTASQMTASRTVGLRVPANLAKSLRKNNCFGSFILIEQNPQDLYVL